MRLLVVNPNTTASMTTAIQDGARAVAGPGVVVDAVSLPTGPVSIESHHDEVMAAPGVVARVLEGELEGYDAFVVACFGDPALLAAREIATGPVVGIAEAAIRTAGYLGRSFSVVTTLARTTGHTRDIARAYGVDALCAGVHACEVPVVELETDPGAYARILAVGRAALGADGSEVVVLGCAGMADLADRLSRDLGVPVGDGVRAAVTTAEQLVRLGLRTSKVGELAAPPVKDYV